MATNLAFTKNADNRWQAEFLSSGEPIALEVNRAEDGYLMVYGSIDGLARIPMHNSGPSGNRNLLVELDVPADVTITVESYTEVTAAKVVGA